MTLLFLATLATAVVAFVLYPVFGERRETVSVTARDEAWELTMLTGKRDRLYETIKDLEFEKDAGKVSEADYQEARNDYVAQVGAVIERLDELQKKTAPAVPPSKRSKKSQKSKKSQAASRDRTGQASRSETEEKTAPASAPAPERRCPSCETMNPEAARFCMGCGQALAATTDCAGCGEPLPDGAAFCIACGAKVEAPA